jgi:hypothetical protein
MDLISAVVITEARKFATRRHNGDGAAHDNDIFFRLRSDFISKPASRTPALAAA